jgi:hypothetical protein
MAARTRAQSSISPAGTFTTLREILVSLASDLDVRADSGEKYELYGANKVTVQGRDLEGMYFASVVARKGGTSLHFFPIYTHPAEFVDLPAPLRKRMTGKSCFQFRTVHPDTAAGVRRMLEKGKRLYRKLGWI